MENKIKTITISAARPLSALNNTLHFLANTKLQLFVSLIYHLGYLKKPGNIISEMSQSESWYLIGS